MGIYINPQTKQNYYHNHQRTQGLYVNKVKYVKLHPFFSHLVCVYNQIRNEVKCQINLILGHDCNDEEIGDANRFSFIFGKYTSYLVFTPTHILYYNCCNLLYVHKPLTWDKMRFISGVHITTMSWLSTTSTLADSPPVSLLYSPMAASRSCSIASPVRLPYVLANVA